MKNWVIYNKKKNVSEISQKFGITPLTSVILCNRDVLEDSEIEKILSSDITDLNDVTKLPDVDKAAKYVYAAINEGKNIRIVGDYDIDGVVATYILYDSLKRIGAKVSYDIPDRIKDGYGINTTIIDKAINDKIDLIITCDNGISADEQITYAKAHGIETVVTDHHDISNTPKDAIAIVNPKREDVEIKYPFREICGAVVAWKFVTYLYKYVAKVDFDPIENYLEFAMIATIGDIMPLINENHIIAKLGLKKILTTRNRGLKRLLDIAGYDFYTKGIDTYHIGFIIGPLINAAGRMDKATLALELFIEDDLDKVFELASKLKELNDERKAMTEKGALLAIEKIEKEYSDDKVLVVYVEDLSEQVAGIVAGRVKEKYNKPAIILTDTFDSKEAKASCRSIDAYDIFEALNKHKDMFLKFGGHKLAAGFSILKDDVDKLRKILNEETILTEKDFIKKVYIDAEFPLTEITEGIINDMDKLLPYGQGFQRPTFATKGVSAHVTGIFGNDNNVIRLNLEKDGKVGKGVIFVPYEEYKDMVTDHAVLDILYAPKVNDYKGYRNIEIIVSDYKNS